MAKQDTQGDGTFQRLLPWAGWVLGPAGWALHETGTYALVPWTCETGTRWPAHLLLALTLAISGLGALVSLRLLRRAEEASNPSRVRFMAWIGFGLSLGSVLGILLEATASFVLDYCTSL